ncbi:sporulation protein [Streptomyces bambusae]|uniref:sporulation protein n=1 Tax=Streptomyces bambusae TaxID=1550616 RepID=UPI001CFC519E|nr:sporulation protein [Streptomyces bambusae]MCB5168506.1 sporulation protein [Streptomyces bambusae]
MAFRKFLSAIGVGAPSVETVVDTPVVRPGETLRCTVTVRGGGADVTVERLRLDVVVRAEDREVDGSTAWNNPYPVVTVDVDGFRLAAGETVTREVAIALPWEMPVTHALGSPLKGSKAAVRTELAIDNSVDRGDFDPVEVHPLPAQDAVFRAYRDLGFRLHESEIKLGLLSRAPRMESRQTEPYWQEIDFHFPESWQRGLGELETVCVARADSLDTHPGGYPPLAVAYADLSQADLTKALDEHVRSFWRV